MITKEEYFKGQEHDDSSEACAEELLERFNSLTEYMKKDMPEFVIQMTSGYRSPTYNATINGAAKQSNHIYGRAIDIKDSDRALARWCLRNQKLLVEHALWCEDPRATKGWVHFQSTPPKSGMRFYVPNVYKAPLCRGLLTEESLS